jgi:Cu(I)/Ag(I) efflux system membrane fusion protein
LKVINDKVDPVANAANIQTAREAFKALSLMAEQLVVGDKTYTVMYCPMAKADWVQTSKDVKNPYYGKAMLTCGGPK